MNYPFALYSLEYPNKGNVRIDPKSDTSFVLKYPCDDTKECTPYRLTLKPGVYQMECWGAKGLNISLARIPGNGSYTSGIIELHHRKTFYIYIGVSGFFNALKENPTLSFGPNGSGGATDVRLEASETWWDIMSLASRIMVAAGGGSSEWDRSEGGNGGELEGGASIHGTYDGKILPTTCKGATQIPGTNCTTEGMYVDAHAIPGEFGGAVYRSEVADNGGIGGGGYYGGTSFSYAYGGSGGSSFISGHNGCNAINKLQQPTDTITHSGKPFHYSGYHFVSTIMIGGDKTKPLPSGDQGTWSENQGAFRLTLISRINYCTQSGSHFHFSITVLIIFIATNI